MNKAFHGSEAHASALRAFLNGKKLHELLFDRIGLINNRPGNELRGSTGGVMLEIREIFHCHPNACCCTEDEGLTFEALSSQSGKKLTGCNIVDGALKVVKHYKQFLKFFKQCADANKDNPSGLKLEDMCIFVRKKVCVLFWGSQNIVGGNKNKECEEDDMPKKHFPNGWFAFVFFGPMPVAGFTLSCLAEDDRNMEKIGRAESRREELQEKKREREAGVGGFVSSDCARGTSVGKKAKAAHLAQTELENDKKNALGLLQQANSDHTATVAELREVRELIREHKEEQPDMEDVALMEGFSEELHSLTQWRIRVISKLGNISKRKEELEKRSELLMDAAPRRVTSSYYEALGPGFVQVGEDSTVSSLLTATPSRQTGPPREVVAPTNNNGVEEEIDDIEENDDIEILDGAENKKDKEDDEEDDEEGSSDDDSRIVRKPRASSTIVVPSRTRCNRGNKQKGKDVVEEETEGKMSINSIEVKKRKLKKEGLLFILIPFWPPNFMLPM